ncbi:hypothetical protein GCM10010195_54070 [Kitasatospora griseola]|nr:hypothetical protein GCM10010195_54070 [Kitasatospora griseola]
MAHRWFCHEALPVAGREGRAVVGSWAVGSRGGVVLVVAGEEDVDSQAVIVVRPVHGVLVVHPGRPLVDSVHAGTVVRQQRDRQQLLRVAQPVGVTAPARGSCGTVKPSVGPR